MNGLEVDRTLCDGVKGIIMKKNIVIGIDPGIANCGVAVVERVPSGYKLLQHSVITTPASTQKENRYLKIYQQVMDTCKENPDATFMGIERVFFNQNKTSCMDTASVIGVCSIAAAQHGMEVIEVPPQNVKEAVSLGCRASKDRMKKRVSLVLKDKALLKEPHHVLDAAATAIAVLIEYHHQKSVVSGEKKEGEDAP